MRFEIPDSTTGKTLQIVVAFALIFAVMAWIEFGGPAILDNDGYYHIRWSAMLRESFPRLPPFQALPLTTLNEQDYVDHHYLFHVLLIPFTFGDLRFGAKLAAAVFASVGITSLFALLVVWRVPYRWLWLAPLVASSEPFLYRMSMTRAPSLSLAFLGLGAYLILKRKLVLLALLSFAFVWLYSLFPLLIAFAFAHTVAVYLCERRIDLGAVTASTLGIAAGMVVNPYFPKNFALFWDHLMMKLTADYSVAVGVEWYPYDSWVLVGSSAVAFALYVAALVAFDFRNRSLDLKPTFFLIVSLGLLLMAVKSRRFIEYWPPFAVLFAAFTIGPQLNRLKAAWAQRMRDQVIAAVAAASIAAALAVTMGFTLLQARRNVRGEADPYAYRGAAEWLAANAPPGALVFNTDWDDFPMLFYYNPNSAYIVGLDPTYLYDRDKELWKLYESVTLGKESNPAPIIRDRFGAQYVFTDNDHTAFLNIAQSSGDFETVYTDRYTTVLRIRSPEKLD
ncbi:MAG TPA: hypothetical protein VNO70_13420 [Blastocatellia bacterium]|nr:hypothetical protein [Blastocatellia bacterium]